MKKQKALKCYVCPYCCGKDYLPPSKSGHKCIGGYDKRKD